MTNAEKPMIGPEDDIILKKGEVCHSKFSAVLLGKTPDQEGDDGTVYVTQRRILFTGKKSLAFSVAKILSTESSVDRLTFHMENGNRISFDTKDILAPSVITHIASIANGGDIEPLQEKQGRIAVQEAKLLQPPAREEIVESFQAKPFRKKRKSRKEKFAEDIFSTVIFLSVAAILYYFFLK